jgi:hypothetical protein
VLHPWSLVVKRESVVEWNQVSPGHLYSGWQPLRPFYRNVLVNRPPIDTDHLVWASISIMATLVVKSWRHDHNTAAGPRRF